MFTTQSNAVSTQSQSTRRSLGERLQAGFTIVELLVVISIIALLIALLLPALEEAKQDANSVACLANLHSQGQMLAEYAAEYKDAIPFCRNAGAIWGTQMWGASAWDTLLFCNNQGISAASLAQAFQYPLSATPMSSQQVYGLLGTWAKIFTCPSATVPLNMGSSTNPVLTAAQIDSFTTYACNPNFFMDCYPPGAQSGAPLVWVNSNPLQDFTVTMSNVANPGQKVAIADCGQALQNGDDGGWPVLPWWQNFFTSLQTASSEDMVSSQGFVGGWNMNTDYPSLGYPWQFGVGGMRYRHGQTNASDDGGWANAVFFDGHAASIPANQLPAGSPGVPPIPGTTGLRVINIINPTLSPNAMQ